MPVSRTGVDRLFFVVLQGTGVGVERIRTHRRNTKDIKFLYCIPVYGETTYLSLK
jgi:hypothetical protein